MPTFETGTPLRASIDLAATGTIVAAVAAKKIVVLNYLLVADTAVAVNWESNTTDISGVMLLGVGIPVAATDNEFGLLETAAGEKLDLTLGAAVQVSGHITYVLV